MKSSSPYQTFVTLEYCGPILIADFFGYFSIYFVTMPNVQRYLFTLILLISLVATARGRSCASFSSNQEVDRPTDTATVNALNEMANHLVDHVQLDSALFLADKALDQAVALNYPQGELAALFHLCTIFYRKGDYEQALQVSMELLQKAIAYDDLLYQARADNTIGLIHLVQKNNQEALVSLKKSAEIKKRINKPVQLASSFFNIALVFMEMDQLDSTYHYLTASRKLIDQNPEAYLGVMINNRLGEYYFKREDISKSIEYFNKVLTDTTYQSDWENSFALTGLANCYYRLGQYDLAKDKAHEALALTLKLNTKWDTERALAILHPIYRELGDYRSAYRYQSMQKIYSDSLLNESKQIEINTLHLKQQKTENEALAEKNKVYEENIYLNRLIILVTVLIAVLLCALAVVFYRNALKKNKLNRELHAQSEEITAKQRLIEWQNHELKQLNQTKDHIFSIIGHDLRSPFNSIISALELIRMDYLSLEEKEELFVQFYKQVTATSILLENLLLWAASQMNGVTAKMIPCQLAKLVQEVISVFETIAQEKRITIEHEPLHQTLIYADQDMVRIILQNIISNAIKFTPEGGFIHIDYAYEAETVTLNVRDSGIGMSQRKLQNLFHTVGYHITSHGTNKEKGNGLGLMLVKRFIEMNKATMEIESEEKRGTTVKVTFCYPPAKVIKSQNEHLAN